MFLFLCEIGLKKGDSWGICICLVWSGFVKSVPNLKLREVSVEFLDSLSVLIQVESGE